MARRRCLEGGHANVRLIRRRPDPQVRARLPRSRHLALRRDVLRRSGRRVRNLAGVAGRPPRVRLLGTARDGSWFALRSRWASPGRPAAAARAPGPLALNEPDYIDEILSAAGFAHVLIERTETLLQRARAAELAEQVGLLAGCCASARPTRRRALT